LGSVEPHGTTLFPRAQATTFAVAH
jgi:hypothetical protein